MLDAYIFIPPFFFLTILIEFLLVRVNKRLRLKVNKFIKLNFHV